MPNLVEIRPVVWPPKIAQTDKQRCLFHKYRCFAFFPSSPTLRIRAWTTRNLPAGAEGRSRGGGTCKKSQNNQQFIFLEKNIYSFSQAKGIRLIDTKVHTKIFIFSAKNMQEEEKKMNTKEEDEEIFFPFVFEGGGETFS